MKEPCEVCGRDLCDPWSSTEDMIECQRLGLERLKAENASLREELEEARNEACVRCGFPTHDIAAAGRLAAAEQRAEAAEKALRAARYWFAAEVVPARIVREKLLAQIDAALHDEERSAPPPTEEM